MHRGSTLILRIVLLLIGLVALVICGLVLPVAIRAELAGDFDYGPIFVGFCVAAVPFFVALHQALKLLGYIDKNYAFSELSVRALRRIKYCALIICGLFTAGMPYIFYVADRDDAPGVVAISLVVIGASFVFATAAAVFERLFQSALEIKSENDLTV